MVKSRSETMRKKSGKKARTGKEERRGARRGDRGRFWEGREGTRRGYKREGQGGGEKSWRSRRQSYDLLSRRESIRVKSGSVRKKMTCTFLFQVSRK